MPHKFYSLPIGAGLDKENFSPHFFLMEWKFKIAPGMLEIAWYLFNDTTLTEKAKRETAKLKIEESGLVAEGAVNGSEGSEFKSH